MYNSIRYPHEIKSGHELDKTTDLSHDFNHAHPMRGDFNFGNVRTSTFNFKDSFIYQMKPSLYVLRIIGAFPVTFGSSGLPKFKFLSAIAVYSVCFYVLLNIPTWALLRDYFLAIKSSGGSLSDSIYVVMFMTIFMFNVWVPSLAWVDVKRACQYLADWTKFQMEFVAVTKEHTGLTLRKHSILWVANSFLGSLIPVVLFNQIPVMTLWRLSTPMVATIYSTITMSLKAFISLALYKAGVALRNQLKRSLQKKPISPSVVEDYRLLWLRWSKLVSQEDHMFGTVYAFTFIKMLFIVVITLYCSLMDVKNGSVDLFRQTNTLGACCVGALILFFFCRNAHVLTDLGNKFQRDLQFISPSTVSSQAWSEVKAFLNVIETNPPVVTAIGFTKVDKTLFVALMSTMVTYMIVLLQFDKGELNFIRSDANTTMGTNT